MLFTSLGSIGVAGEGPRPGADILARIVSEPGELFATPHGDYKRIDLAGGGQLWLHLAPAAAGAGASANGDVASLARRLVGLTPFHKGLGSVRVDVQSAIALDRNDPMTGGWVLAMPALADGDRPLPLVLEMVPFRLIETTSVRFSANVQVLGLAAEASVYASPAAFLERAAPAKLMPIGGVAPLTVGSSAEPNVAAASELRCVALVTGRIEAARRIRSPLTGQDYFWLAVSTARGLFNIVANARVLLGALPVPGAIVQAKARLLACPADRAVDIGPETDTPLAPPPPSSEPSSSALAVPAAATDGSAARDTGASAPPVRARKAG